MFITTAGATDVESTIRIQNLDGSAKTDVVAATGLTLYYRRQASAAVQVTPLSDLASLATVHTDKGMLHKADGYYRVDIPDAAFAAAAGINFVEVYGTLTDTLVTGTLHILNIAPAVNINLADSMTLKGTAVTVSDASTFTATLVDRDNAAVSITTANILRNKSITVLTGAAKYAVADINSSSWDAGNSRTNFALKSTRTLATAMSPGDTFLISAF